MLKNKENSVRGEKILKILEVIEDTAMHSLGLFLAISSSRNYKTINKNYNAFIENKGGGIRELVDDIKEWRRFKSAISYLKKEGLIISNNNNWITTIKGKEKIKKLGKKIILNRKYPVEASHNLIVFIYDIPERYRPERLWIRRTLNNLGYKMRQKSVWLGKNKLPKDFIEDLKKLKMTDYVEFFAITKIGTLE